MYKQNGENGASYAKLNRIQTYFYDPIFLSEMYCQAD